MVVHTRLVNHITLLRVREGRVEARYDYDEEDVRGEFLDVDDVRRVLDDWRARIQENASASTAPLPETYRRNPSPGLSDALTCRCG